MGDSGGRLRRSGRRCDVQPAQSGENTDDGDFSDYDEDDEDFKLPSEDEYSSEDFECERSDESNSVSESDSEQGEGGFPADDSRRRKQQRNAPSPSSSKSSGNRRPRLVGNFLCNIDLVCVKFVSIILFLYCRHMTFLLFSTDKQANGFLFEKAAQIRGTPAGNSCKCWHLSTRTFQGQLF